jgi:hypothetical protein
MSEEHFGVSRLPGTFQNNISTVLFSAGTANIDVEQWLVSSLMLAQ